MSDRTVGRLQVRDGGVVPKQRTGASGGLLHDWNQRGRGEGGPVAGGVELDDETLRDGLQSPSVLRPTIAQKIELLHRMEALQIDSADLGYPGAGSQALEDVVALADEISKSRLKIRANCAGRTAESDIVPMAEAQQRTGVPIEAAVFLGSSPIRQFTEGWDMDFLLRTTEEAVRLARSLEMDVMYVTEDTTRARPSDLRRLYTAAIEAGARRICIADTVGHATPVGVRNLVRFIGKVVEDVGEPVKIDWHGHRDRGLDIPNALAAIQAGAHRVHGCALGIGERVGNTAMDLLLVNLKLLGWIERDLSDLPGYCQVASEATGVAISPNYPVIGKDAFETSTGVHAAAILKALRKGDRWLANRVYSGVPADEIGREQVISVGPMSGKANVVGWLVQRGLEAEPDTVERIFAVAKTSDHVLEDDEILEYLRPAGRTDRSAWDVPEGVEVFPAGEQALLTGNEAVARGAYEAGVRVASGYPGTPSTEILEALGRFEDVDVGWSSNEKVGMDLALGATVGGVRALVTMKHVGLNVASDTLMTAAYTGVGAGLVVVVADDPGMHSSQNEQDSRVYARFAGVPMLEPSDSHEAKEFTRLAFEISEEFDTPVLIRYTTRIAHGRGVVGYGPVIQPDPRGFHRDPAKYVMLPSNAQRRRPIVLERLERLEKYAHESPITRVEMRDPAVGVVTAGIAYQYVREVAPDVSVLKLGVSHPLPMERIRAFAERVGRVLVVEELDPLLEDALRAAGLRVEGKEHFPRMGELGPDAVRAGFESAGVLSTRPEEITLASPAITPRPPVLCAGCPHATPFMALKQLGAVVSGDIGCYTLAALPPLSAMDTCVAMGSSIGMAIGLAKSGGTSGPVVATIGDSTFLHAGIPALIDAVHSQADMTVVILDNGTTAMTGGQPHAASGTTLRGADAAAVDIAELCRSVGVSDVRIVDPYELGEVYVALEEAMARPGPSVVITNRPCVEAPTKIRDHPFEVVASACIACQLCMNVGCPSITWTDEWFDERRKVTIDAISCTGCTVCAQMCPAGAIIPVAGWEESRVG